MRFTVLKDFNLVICRTSRSASKPTARRSRDKDKKDKERDKERDKEKDSTKDKEKESTNRKASPAREEKPVVTKPRSR